MRQQITSDHELDQDGLPAGGTTFATGITIQWQNRPLVKGDTPNGAFVEGVVLAAIDRLKFYQSVSSGRFSCRENALAITKLEEGLHWLDERTRARIERGVEGTHNP